MCVCEKCRKLDKKEDYLIPKHRGKTETAFAKEVKKPSPKTVKRREKYEKVF